MGHLCHFPIFALSALASLISCSNASPMDATDDEMAGPMSPAEVDAACSACFETDCAWEATECAADPQCATWMTCVKADGVAGGCANPGGRTAQGLQSAVASCLSDCCTTRDPGTEANAAGAGGGTDWGGAGAPLKTGEWQCADTQCSCSDCVTGVGNDDLGGSCSLALEQCTGKCNLILEEHYACQSPADTGTTAGWRELESCLFQKFQAKADADPHYHEAIEQFMQSMMPCMVNECATHCLPANAQACLSCQEKSCGDEMNIFRSDSNAILYTWCRSFCQINQHDGCPNMCEIYLQGNASDSTSNQATLDALRAYGECALRCPDC